MHQYTVLKAVYSPIQKPQSNINIHLETGLLLSKNYQTNIHSALSVLLLSLPTAESEIFLFSC